MGHRHDFDWARFAGLEGAEQSRHQHRDQHRDEGRRGPGGRRGGPWAEFADWGRGPGGGGFGGGRGRSGPPPWMAGLFGLAQGTEERRGPRVRRGDVRTAILDVLRTAEQQPSEDQEPINGYQIIQEIEARTEGAWKPSPGSVYPTISQLQDEGLVEAGEGRTRTALSLTADGRAYVEEHADRLAAVWAPFERRAERDVHSNGGLRDVKNEIGQVMGAVWQIVTNGSPAQQQAAVGVLVDTRRKLYGILADGDEGLVDESDETAGADAQADGGTHDDGQTSSQS